MDLPNTHEHQPSQPIQEHATESRVTSEQSTQRAQVEQGLETNLDMEMFERNEATRRSLEDTRPVEAKLSACKQIFQQDLLLFDGADWDGVTLLLTNRIQLQNMPTDVVRRRQIEERILTAEQSPEYNRALQSLYRLAVTPGNSALGQKPLPLAQKFYTRTFLLNFAKYIRELRQIQTDVDGTTFEESEWYAYYNEQLDTSNAKANAIALKILPYSYPAFDAAGITTDSPLQWTSPSVLRSMFAHNVTLEHIPFELSGPELEGKINRLLENLGIPYSEEVHTEMRFIVEHLRHMKDDIQLYADANYNGVLEDIRLHEVFANIEEPLFLEGYQQILEQVTGQIPDGNPADLLDLKLKDLVDRAMFDFSKIKSTVSFSALPESVKTAMYQNILSHLRQFDKYSHKTDEELIEEISQAVAYMGSNYAPIKLSEIETALQNRGVLEQDVIEYIVDQTITPEQLAAIKQSIMLLDTDSSARQMLNETLEKIIVKDSATLTLKDVLALHTITELVQDDKQDLKAHPLLAVEVFSWSDINTEQGRTLSSTASSVYGRAMLNTILRSLREGKLTLPEGYEVGEDAENVMRYSFDRSLESLDYTQKQLEALNSENPEIFWLLVSLGVLAVSVTGYKGYVLFNTYKLRELATAPSGDATAKLISRGVPQELAESTHASIKELYDTFTKKGPIGKIINRSRMNYVISFAKQAENIDEFATSLVRRYYARPGFCVEVLRNFEPDLNRLQRLLISSGMESSRAQAAIANLTQLDTSIHLEPLERLPNDGLIIEGSVIRRETLHSVDDCKRQLTSIVDELAEIQELQTGRIARLHQFNTQKVQPFMVALQEFEATHPEVRRILAEHIVGQRLSDADWAIIQAAHNETTIAAKAAKLKALEHSVADLALNDPARLKVRTNIRQLMRTGITGEIALDTLIQPNSVDELAEILGITEPQHWAPKVTAFVKQYPHSLEAMDQVLETVSQTDVAKSGLAKAELTRIRIAVRSTSTLVKRGLGIALTKGLPIAGFVLEALLIQGTYDALKAAEEAGDTTRAQLLQSKLDTDIQAFSSEVALGGFMYRASQLGQLGARVTIIGGLALTAGHLTKDALYAYADEMNQMTYDRYRSERPDQNLQTIRGADFLALINTKSTEEFRTSAALDAYVENLHLARLNETDVLYAREMLVFDLANQQNVEYSTMLQDPKLLQAAKEEKLSFVKRAIAEFIDYTEGKNIEWGRRLELATAYAELKHTERRMKQLYGADGWKTYLEGLQEISSIVPAESIPTISPEEVLTASGFDTALLQGYRKKKALDWLMEYQFELSRLRQIEDRDERQIAEIGTRVRLATLFGELFFVHDYNVYLSKAPDGERHIYKQASFGPEFYRQFEQFLENIASMQHAEHQLQAVVRLQDSLRSTFEPGTVILQEGRSTYFGD